METPFNPDPSKQAQEVSFSNKGTTTNQPNIIFNGNTVQNSGNQKHLSLILDEKLTFNDHITSKLTTVYKLTSTWSAVVTETYYCNTAGVTETYYCKQITVTTVATTVVTETYYCK